MCPCFVTPARPGDTGVGWVGLFLTSSNDNCPIVATAPFEISVLFSYSFGLTRNQSLVDAVIASIQLDNAALLLSTVTDRPVGGLPLAVAVSFLVRPIQFGDISVTVPAGVIHDRFGQPNDRVVYASFFGMAQHSEPHGGEC